MRTWSPTNCLMCLHLAINILLAYTQVGLRSERIGTPLVLEISTHLKPSKPSKQWTPRSFHEVVNSCTSNGYTTAHIYLQRPESTTASGSSRDRNGSFPHLRCRSTIRFFSRAAKNLPSWSCDPRILAVLLEPDQAALLDGTARKHSKAPPIQSKQITPHPICARFIMLCTCTWPPGS